MVKNTDYMADNFEHLQLDALKDSLVKYLKEIKALEAEKKDYVSSIKDTIKELKLRIDSVIYWIGVKETKAERKALENAAEKALKG